MAKTEKPDMIVHETEILVVDRSKKTPSINNLTYSDITRVSFEKRKIKKLTNLFKKEMTDAIVIVTQARGWEDPIEVHASNNAEIFDSLKEDIKKFVKKHMISFQDNL